MTGLEVIKYLLLKAWLLTLPLLQKRKKKKNSPLKIQHEVFLSAKARLQCSAVLCIQLHHRNAITSQHIAPVASMYGSMATGQVLEKLISTKHSRKGQ